jgi:hypothetical protein
MMLGNLVPANAIVKVAGDSTNSCATLFKNQPRLTVQLTPFSTATFADDQGAIFDFVQTGVATVADTEGSFASVTAAEVGLGANTVVTRKLHVAPNSGGVLVDLTLWEQSGNFNKAWTAQASSASAQITYVVGDLQPGSSYRVRQGSNQLATPRADSQGYISFTTIPETTAALSYTVRRR